MAWLRLATLSSKMLHREAPLTTVTKHSSLSFGYRPRADAVNSKGADDTVIG